MATVTFHAARLVARLRDARLATVLTENGYALCARHAQRWRAGGWDGHMTVMSPAEVSLNVTGAATDRIECVNCEDEGAAADLAADQELELALTQWGSDGGR